MYELIINAIKIATSRDARESASSLIQLAKRSPEWKKDICTIEAKIRKSDREQATLLAELVESKLSNLGYRNATIDDFEVVFDELTSNGFEHGCKVSRSVIQLVIDVSGTYVALTVLNPSRSKFDFDKAIKKAGTNVKRDSLALRGEGLRLVTELADTFEAARENNGAKAVLYRGRVVLKTILHDDVAIISVTNPDSLFNPSLERRVLASLGELKGKNVVLDFSTFKFSEGDVINTRRKKRRRRGKITTRRRRLVLRAYRVHAADLPKLPKFRRAARKATTCLVALFDMKQNERPGLNLPPELVASSWAEALEKIGRPELLPKVQPKRQRPRLSVKQRVPSEFTTRE